MNYRKIAEKINAILFDNAIDLDNVKIEMAKGLVGGDNIAGITIALKKGGGERLSYIFLFSKFCKGKAFTFRVIAHELVHAYQNQLHIPINHNGALMRHYCKKARAMGIEIDMKRF